MIKNKQNFRIDEFMLVLIVALFAVGVNVYHKISEQHYDLSKIEAEKISNMIDETKLIEMKNADYDDIKNSLHVKNDFCIYLEDDNGNIIFAKGSRKLSRDGLKCKE